MELDFCNHVLGHLKIGVEKVLGIKKILKFIEFYRWVARYLWRFLL